jgi:hypothetical protein
LSTTFSCELLLIISDSQLAVCKGLVIDCVHKLKYNQSVLSIRHCLSSYGILFNDIFNKKRHSNEQTKVRKNSIDKQNYAVDRIHWLVRKGEELRHDKPICQQFYRIVSTNNSQRDWEDIIVISDTRRDRLPASFNEGDAKKVGKILSTLDPQSLAEGQEDVKRKGKRYFGFKVGEYWRINLEIRVFIRFADLKFEIWFADNQIGSQDDDIDVTWTYVGGGGLGRHDTEDDERDADAWQGNLVAVHE